MPEGDAPKSRRPPDNPFRQQTLSAWRPILTPAWVIGTFTAIGLVFIPVGAVCLAASQNVVEVISAPYDDACCANCGSGDSLRVDLNPCALKVTVPETMKPPIKMYYMLEGFYQNHRRYVKSRSDRQLRGEKGLKPSQLTDCVPRAYADPDGEDDLNNVINPCGLISWSLFNDTFSLTDPNGKAVPLGKKGIAWQSDVEDKFKNSEETGTNFPPFAGKDCSPGSGQCVEDEDFIVWMRTAGLPTFRKLYRTIDEELPAGEYTIHIRNGLEKASGKMINPATNEEQTSLYPVHPFNGHKYVILTTSSWIGGKNDFLGYAYMIVGAISLLLAIGFFAKHKISPRKLGDTQYLIWSKDGTH